VHVNDTHLYVEEGGAAIILLKILGTAILNSITCTPGVQREKKKFDEIWSFSEGSPNNLTHLQLHNLVCHWDLFTQQQGF